MTNLADYAIAVPHVIKGRTVTGRDVEYGPPRARFATPAIQINDLVWPRTEQGPAFDVPVAEIIDVLVALGGILKRDPSGYLAEAAERCFELGPLPKDILQRAYDDIPALFRREEIETQLVNALGGPEVLDGWVETKSASGCGLRVRAFPPRLIHILAGNVPGVAACSIIRGALTKGVNLFKLPSNDLFSATAMLRYLADVAPGHPVTQSFSAVYWRGGDETIERQLCRPIYFDKVVAWGGEGAIRSIKKFVGPGFELVSFDPKTSISMIGREVFRSEAELEAVANAAAEDATAYNQSACVCSRIQYVEGDEADVDRYCTYLQAKLGLDRHTASAKGPAVPTELRGEIDGLRDLEPMFRVWGDYNGAGVVVRSEEPVDFYPDNKIVNVVPVAALKDAVRYVNVATQTIGVYPPERKAELRDALASGGAQRVVTLGRAIGSVTDGPHDGFLPLHRFMRWVADED